MAGWKLRKDKTLAETPGTEPEGGAQVYQTEEPASLEEPTFHDIIPGPLPDFESDSDLHFSTVDFDSDDEPLTLVDYSESESDPLSPGVFAPASVFTESPIIAMPPETPSIVPISDFQQRLRTGQFDASELAPPPDFSTDYGSGIPMVAPFVLDTPVAAAPPPPAPELIVHIGRLSAAFAVTKDVTTIGRPDSALHYYPDVEIEMDDAVSRRHAEVVKREDSFYLVDTGSTNGTMLNGEVLPPHQERLLAHGDRIRVGDRTEIIFE
ncbi:MAG: FHA domain-containing protein [Janthinobacterium lividum]